MNPAQFILLGLIRAYRWIISPAKSLIFGPLGRCRFTPSCSLYALEAVRNHGAAPGGWLALKRLGRCHPWGGCGHDPVPTVRGSTTKAFTWGKFTTRTAAFHGERPDLAAWTENH